MNDIANIATGTKPRKMQVTVSRAASPDYRPGRRDFFKYRDLGVTAGTHGRMRAQLTSTEAGLSKPTGWHYHTCEVQFVYMLSGWIDLEFEDGELVRLEAGDSVMIPGGARHQEIKTSPTFELLELSLPAEMGTVDCEPPPGAKFK